MTRRVTTAREQAEMLAPWIRHADRIDWEWERDYDGDWLLVTRTPDGRPVAVPTRRAPYDRTAALEDAAPPDIHDLMPGRFSDGNGRWDYRHRETSGDHYLRHEYGIHPATAPATHTFTNGFGRTHTVHYDPALTGGQEPRPGEFRQEWDDPQALRTPITALNPPQGMLWRGMSREEYEQARDRGYFESDGNHNIGDIQKGHTFFSTDPEQAGNYATWFAPPQFKPTFTHPGYVIGIPDRPDLPRGADPTRPDPSSTEVGVPGRVPFSEVTHHYVGRPSVIRPGHQGVAEGWHGWEQSGGAHPSSEIVWQQLHPQRHTAALDLPDHVMHTARVDAAEQVMTNVGLNGRTFHIPRARVDEAHGLGIEPWELQKRHSREAEDYVNGILGDWGWEPAQKGHRIKVHPGDYRLRNAEQTTAHTDGFDRIGLAGEHTDELTLLHETAHILAGTMEHDNHHGPEFQNILHVLYHDHLGPEAAEVFGNIVFPGQRTARLAMPEAVGSGKPLPGYEEHLRGVYEKYPPDSPTLPDNLKPHLMLPLDAAHHYREYDRPQDDENMQVLRRVIGDQGIREPLKISTDGSHAMLIEGNHRINVARQLGMSHVPVRVYLEKPGEVMTNSETSRPVPLEPVLGNWIRQNSHQLRSFWS